MPREETRWYKDAIIYEVQLRAFADSNGDGIGDFVGLTEKLGYLRDLGITAIWLTPFYPSPLRDGGYDISDYYGIHPDYGTLPEFLRFLEVAHQLGLRVITELVINHTSIDHPWFQRACRAAPGSVDRDFYVWSDTPDRYSGARIIFKDFERSNWAWEPEARAYYWHRFYSYQPDLNFDNPAVHEAIFDVVDFWLGFGVDGVRLDAIPYLYEREGTTCENLPETHAFLKKLRAHVDSKFSDRMLLAEANQWPADAAAYFGDGDECHMNFHFPLMPRLFMAVHLEDSFPIVDILAQTPEIPESCQWATFLRNHDELTLEMVTEEDRDYMYRTYASDHRARLNLGIRRRLAPLLGDRRRLELLNAILFTLPGTPVLYYGDEIGMGDNIYLGDRDGVRTPMQWNSDRNAGFSRANPQRLFLPVVVDPQYHFEAINVEAQQADPASLLWWMKYLIHTRKSRKVFSQGSIRFLDHENGKVLAFVREYDGEQVLFVANLSRFAQYATLLVADYLGKQPVEMQGKSRFPRIESDRWGISLGPYDHVWLDLLPPRAVDHGLREPLVTTGPWWEVGSASGDALAERIGEFLRGREWFRGRGRDLGGIVVRDVVPLEVSGQPLLLTVVQADWGAAASEMCLVPLGYASAAAAREIEHGSSRLVVTALLSSPPDGGHAAEAGFLLDPSSRPDYADRLLGALQRSERIEGRTGVLTFTALDGLDEALATGSVELRSVELDQTVRFFGSQVVLKLLRGVDEGVNAEEEMLRFLMRFPEQRLAPGLLGKAVWRSRGGGDATLAIATRYVQNRGTARELFADGLQAYLERVLATADAAPTSARVPSGGFPGADAWTVLSEPMPSLIELLARRTAELHRVLASEPSDPAFAPEAFDVLHRQSLYQSARGHVSRTFVKLRRRLPSLDEAHRDAASRLLGLESELLERLHDITSGPIKVWRIRSHGDLRLEEVLFTGDNFVFIDFEGESGRPLRERRYKRCGLRDVAAIVRSLEATAHVTLRRGRVRLEDRVALAPRVQAWSSRLAAQFVETYSAELLGTSLVPRSAGDLRRLLRFYVIEACIHEVSLALDGDAEGLAAALSGLQGAFVVDPVQ